MEATKTAQQNTLLPDYAIRPPALKAVRVFLIGVPLILNEVGKRILDPAF
jgi:RPA family protein